MFSRILLPTDFSEGAGSALIAARRIAQTWNSTIHLVHVDEEHALGMHSSDDLIRYMNEIDSRRREWMERQASELSDEGFDVELVRLEGTASEQILEYAEAQSMGLIVMGTKGHSTMEYLLLGSTTAAVLRHAPCPVLTISVDAEVGDDWEPKRVLYPTDFSQASVAGLPLLAEVTTRLEASLEILHVLKAPTFVPAIPGEPPFYVTPGAYGVANERALADLETLAGQAPIAELSPEHAVTIAGDTAEGISLWAKERGCDLVVIPRHGHGAVRSILFGRVVEHVVKRAPLPVLSFHPDRTDRDD